MLHKTRLKELPLMEAFYTVQGEGFYQGNAAYFIRLGGCDVGCHWCDVKESWDVNIHPSVSIKKIVEEANSFPAKIVVITGGEPLMHDLTSLTEALHEQSFNINIETAGVHPLSGELDWICFSPKKFKEPLPEIYHHANELKVIVYNKSDLAWAEKHAAKINSDCKLYLQPEWGKSKDMLPVIIDYIKKEPKWKISLQTHKYMDIP